ncbi:MAG TPA: formate dehydrogenase accessory sulfurtransferase FdhD [Acidimicrobiia bacterium]
MTRAASGSAPIVAVRAGQRRQRPDRLATEEPLEIRVAGPGQEPVSASVTMRTPGHDFELAAGFLFAEGLVAAADVRTIRYCPRDATGHPTDNVVTVDLRRRIDPGAFTRRFAASAACGVCGKATLDDLEVRCAPVGPGPRLAASRLPAFAAGLRAGQTVFDRTGGLHAAALFDAGGERLAVREDVGRHNAVDKIIGHALLAEALPLADRVLMVSGRLGFEIVQKAAAAGIPVIVAVSAPSTLAVETADRFGITLVGFLRGDDFNVYCHPERLDFDA